MKHNWTCSWKALALKSINSHWSLHLTLFFSCFFLSVSISLSFTSKVSRLCCNHYHLIFFFIFIVNDQHELVVRALNWLQIIFAWRKCLASIMCILLLNTVQHNTESEYCLCLASILHILNEKKKRRKKKQQHTTVMETRKLAQKFQAILVAITQCTFQVKAA